ncbi:MAG: cupredoxin domain-containing protein [Candidatus Promineifilaceae bacterium]|nr:cupredoxin domain-containing protein [Candidatus Promineifilaceae bacterium]
MNTIQTPKTKPLAEIIIFVLIATAVALTVLIFARLGLLPFVSTRSVNGSGAVVISAKEFKFSQSELRVTAGEAVRLTLNNNDRLPHSFDLDEFDIHIYMPGSERVISEFTPTKPGNYTYYCGIPGHEELGMTGTLIVEPGQQNQ